MRKPFDTNVFCFYSLIDFIIDLFFLKKSYSVVSVSIVVSYWEYG